MQNLQRPKKKLMRIIKSKLQNESFQIFKCVGSKGYKRACLCFHKSCGPLVLLDLGDSLFILRCPFPRLFYLGSLVLKIF